MTGRRRTRNQISGGIFFSAVIQGRDVTVVLPRELTPAMAGLRDASVVFTGRDGDLEQLIGLIDPATRAAPRTTAVSGLPGVGKTELVLHAAHEALRAGWFPGGVLFIDMFGYAPEPGRKTTAGAALDSLLRAAGMPAEHIPAADQDRSRLFASVLARYAEEGSPVLLVIDNVSTAAQVTPLIPAAGKVLVTSRHRLPLQNARRLELDKLSEAAGLELLAAELALVVGSDPRAASQPADAAAIARLCDGLPLALQIVAALLAAHPSRPLSSMAADLQDTRTRLDEMRYREPGGAELAVESAFDLSYHQLDAQQRRIFRLLPLNQGPEISAAAVAAMTSLGEPAARRSLEELERAHLIEAGGADRHWRMHDLLRVYALGLADESGDIPRAIGLLLAYYVDTVGAATRQLEPTPTRRPGDPFTDRAQALAWLDTEYPNLTPYGNLVIFEPAALRPATAALFLRLWRYFELRRLTDDWIRLTDFALVVARMLGDREQEADALTKLSGGLRHARRFDDAIAACQEAIGIQRELGNRHAEGIALNNLAAAQYAAGRHSEAIASTQAAAAIFSETGDRHREGIALAHLGDALASLEQYVDSIAAYRRALVVFRETGDRLGEGAALMNLGLVLGDAGERGDEAVAAEQDALAILSAADDRHGAVQALVHLVGILTEAGRFDEAVTAAGEAVTQARGLASVSLEGSALLHLAMALEGGGRGEQAAEALRNAATAYHRGGNGDGEADAHLRLGHLLHREGLLPKAADAYRSAADHHHQTGNRGEEARALFSQALALRQAGRFQEAIEPARGAVSAYRQAGNRDQEAKSLLLLGAVLGCGRIDEAITADRHAAAIRQEIGDQQGLRRALGILQSHEQIKSVLDEGRALLNAGRYEEASTLYQTITLAFRELGDRHNQAVTSASLGTALRGAGRFDEAIAVLAETAGVFGELGDTDREQETRAELVAAQQDQARVIQLDPGN
jgi:tetratricopeptide (TPR) repeat protein